MFNFEKVFSQPPQEDKEKEEKEIREKIEDEAAAKRRAILDGVLDNIFTKTGEPKKGDEAESTAIKGLKWLSQRSNLLRGATATTDAYTGETIEGKKLSPKERLVRGLAGAGSFLAWAYKVKQEFPGTISPDEEGVQGIEERVEPWLRDMAEYEIRGKSEEAMRNAADRRKGEGRNGEADILEKSAEVMRDNSDIVEKAETEIQSAIGDIREKKKALEREL